MSMLFCERPHGKTIDFDTSRFVVSSAFGVKLSAERTLERGEEVPAGVLDARALRTEYDVHRIDEIAYAFTKDPDLREACARKGVVFELPPVIPVDEQKESPRASQPGGLDLASLNRSELAAMCKGMGLSSNGNIQQLRDRISAVLD